MKKILIILCAALIAMTCAISCKKTETPKIKPHVDDLELLGRWYAVDRMLSMTFTESTLTISGPELEEVYDCGTKPASGEQKCFYILVEGKGEAAFIYTFSNDDLYITPCSTFGEAWCTRYSRNQVEY